MTQLGADPDHLRGLARSLRTAAGRLDTLSTGLARRLRQSDWRGPDAAAVTMDWQDQHRPRLRAAADGLVELATRAEQHAVEQDLVSGDGAAAGRAGPGPAGPLPPPSRSEDRITGGIDARLGPVSAGIAGDVTVHDIGRDRRRVVVSQVVAAGAIAAVGSSADVALGGPTGAGAATKGASGEGRVRTAAISRRSWDVRADHVDDLLTRLALDEAGRAVTGTPDALVRAVDLADTVAGWLTRHDQGWDAAAAVLTAMPDPDGRETLAQVELAGAMGVGAGAFAGLGARTQGVTALRIGDSVRDAARSTVVEWDAAGSAALTSTLLRRIGVTLPLDHAAAVAVRVELPEGVTADGDRVASMRISATTDERIEEVRALLVFDSSSGLAAGATLDRALAELGRGDLAGAAAQLDLLRVSPSEVQVQLSTAQLGGASGRAGAGAGAGLGVGVSARGQVLHLERS